MTHAEILASAAHEVAESYRAPTLATLTNMRAHYKDDLSVFALSEGTGEEASANPRDYWWIEHDSDPLVDSEGEPMILARRSGIELI